MPKNSLRPYSPTLILKKDYFTFTYFSYLTFSLYFVVFNIEKGLDQFLTEKELHHFLPALKVFTMKKGLHHFLTTLKRFNSKKHYITLLPLLKFLILIKESFNFLGLLNCLILKKGLHQFPTTLRVFDTEKRLHQFLRTLKDFNTEKGLHHFLMTLLKILKSDSNFVRKILFIRFNESPFKNYGKCFLFHLKSSFRSRDI